MCVMNYQPINEYCCPCGSCSEYLTTCKPIVIDSFVYGECDINYCEFCNEDCMEKGY